MLDRRENRLRFLASFVLGIVITGLMYRQFSLDVLRVYVWIVACVLVVALVGLITVKRPRWNMASLLVGGYAQSSIALAVVVDRAYTWIYLAIMASYLVLFFLLGTIFGTKHIFPPLEDTSSPTDDGTSIP